jgi:hypothetical protein
MAQHKLVLSCLLFGVWILLVSVALYRLNFTDYGEFDADFRWHGVQAKLDVALLQLPASDDWQLVHVLAPACRCSVLAQQHIAQLSTELALRPEQQFYRSAAEIAAAGLLLPALPAVLVLQQGQLIYAGPYASGPECSAATSFLPALVRGELRLSATWLNGETKACRCLQPSE